MVERLQMTTYNPASGTNLNTAHGTRWELWLSAADECALISVLFYSPCVRGLVEQLISINVSSVKL